ncbi:ATP-binding protein [Thermodesulfobacteriota bacterium]
MNIRLLIVDDEVDFRQTISKRLQKRGIVPEQAGTGEECLSILDKRAMDVVILDVMMPGMNGIETLIDIKKRHPKTEIILLTGHTVIHDGVEGIKAGAFDYLSKPVELEHLISKIKHAHEKILREEEKLRESEYRARMEQQMIACERLASLGTLAAGVAHEINNPLAIIKESAGWMKHLLEKEGLKDMPRKQDFFMALAKIENGVERSKRITHQLLAVVKKNDSVLSQVDLKHLAGEAVQLTNREAIDKEIEIIQESDTSLNTIWSDPYQLRQAIINLLTNAIHATGAGGRITVNISDNNDEISLNVRDTGEGIPKENLERIFEPFFSTKSPGEGTGLGLFVTRGIVERLGGTIEVQSQLGQGASFNIKLPKYHEMNEELA